MLRKNYIMLLSGIRDCVPSLQSRAGKVLAIKDHQDAEVIAGHILATDADEAVLEADVDLDQNLGGDHVRAAEDLEAEIDHDMIDHAQVPRNDAKNQNRIPDHEEDLSGQDQTVVVDDPDPKPKLSLSYCQNLLFHVCLVTSRPG